VRRLPARDPVLGKQIGAGLGERQISA
jgi:hypothetical protein